MRTRSELALRVLKTAQQMLTENIKALTLEEAARLVGRLARRSLHDLQHRARRRLRMDERQRQSLCRDDRRSARLEVVD